MRFALALDPTGELAASRAPGLYENAFAEVDDVMVRVSVGRPVCFYAEIPRAAILRAERAPDLQGKVRSLTRGIHGSSGKWLVNGSSTDLVRLVLAPGVEANLSVNAQALPSLSAPSEARRGSRVGRFLARQATRERTVKLRELRISLVDADAFCEELG